MRTAFTLSVSLFLGIGAFAAAIAQPQLPATYYGSVTISGEPASSGIEIRGFVNGIDCSQSPPGEHLVIREGAIAAYVLHVVHESQRPGCGKENSVVTFTIDGAEAIQKAPWKVGPNRLDLSTGSASPIPLPSPTGTIGAVIGSAAAGTIQPSASATLERPTGTPPTDDIRFDGTVPSVPGGRDTPSGDGNSSLLVAVVVVLGLLALAGGGAGLFLARRSRTASEENET